MDHKQLRSFHSRTKLCCKRGCFFKSSDRHPWHLIKCLVSCFKSTKQLEVIFIIVHCDILGKNNAILCHKVSGIHKNWTLRRFQNDPCIILKKKRKLVCRCSLAAHWPHRWPSDCFDLRGRQLPPHSGAISGARASRQTQSALHTHLRTLKHTT